MVVLDCRSDWGDGDYWCLVGTETGGRQACETLCSGLASPLEGGIAQP